MKKKPGLWIIMAIAIALATGINTHNLPAAICIGIGGSMLLMIITNMEADCKNRN